MTVDKLAVGAVITNCYIVSDGETKDAVVIDPGAAADKIGEKIREKDLNLRAILLTHGHFDHILAAEKLREEFSVKLYCSKAEREVCMDPGQNVGRTFGFSCSVVPDQTFDDGEELSFGALSCKVIATPGHTKGGVCFYFDAEGVLFSGDTLFFESVGRTDFPGGNAKLLVDSVKERIFVLPDATKVYPGHGPATSVAYEKENNPYVNEEGYLY
ncbi:MAG: MBL fold metallo-hydrolase [Lachnospiraceae bacterium]|nr:MBL fold metallo-hydrolase [Lachnospiraceae bacterium]